MQVGVSTVVSSSADVGFVRQCEQVGATSVWVPEAWGYDALTPLAHPARTPRSQAKVSGPDRLDTVAQLVDIVDDL